MLVALGTLFGINQILTKSFVLVQTGLVDPDVFGSLQVCKERLFKELRPSLITLVDGIGFPDGVIRSHIVGDNLYEDLLTQAKKVELNKEVIPAAMIVKTIHTLKPHL